jgi:hypothetical protein
MEEIVIRQRKQQSILIIAYTRIDHAVYVGSMGGAADDGYPIARRIPPKSGATPLA